MSFKTFLNERSGGHLLRRNGAINNTDGRGLKEEHLCEGISNLCQWFRRCGLKKKVDRQRAAEDGPITKAYFQHFIIQFFIVSIISNQRVVVAKRQQRGLVAVAIRGSVLFYSSTIQRPDFHSVKTKFRYEYGVDSIELRTLFYR